MPDNKTLWDSVLVEMELIVSKANFATWFRDTFIIKQDDGMVHLSVPNAFVRGWLQEKFHRPILESLRQKGEHIRGIEYIVAKNDDKKKGDQGKDGGMNMGHTGELPLHDLYINKDDNLNPKYTFETFVVGPFNELAHAAAQAIIKKPGSVYNPLFIYGDTGRGKTHLIQAIGNALKSQQNGKKIYYITSEKFAIDYVNSLQANKVNAFKEKYRAYDVLIMDDIQFFSKTEKTQEELFHLFNALYEQNKQIIFSSDKHPNYIPNLEDRLKSRFGAGMIVDVPAPDHESRVAIIRAKSAQNGFQVPPEVMDFLASSIEGNIRELEGIINALICQTQLKNRELSLADVRNLVKNNLKPKKMVAPKDVIKVIADFYGIEEESIYEKTRKKEIVKPRQLIMYILREDFNVSYPSIGQKLGGRDHTTVMHSCEKIKNDLKADPTLGDEITQIRAML